MCVCVSVCVGVCVCECVCMWCSVCMCISMHVPVTDTDVVQCLDLDPICNPQLLSVYKCANTPITGYISEAGWM